MEALGFCQPKDTSQLKSSKSLAIDNKESESWTDVNSKGGVKQSLTCPDKINQTSLGLENSPSSKHNGLISLDIPKNGMCNNSTSSTHSPSTLDLSVNISNKASSTGSESDGFFASNPCSTSPSKSCPLSPNSGGYRLKKRPSLDCLVARLHHRADETKFIEPEKIGPLLSPKEDCTKAFSLLENVSINQSSLTIESIPILKNDKVDNSRISKRQDSDSHSHSSLGILFSINEEADEFENKISLHNNCSKDAQSSLKSHDINVVSESSCSENDSKTENSIVNYSTEKLKADEGKSKESISPKATKEIVDLDMKKPSTSAVENTSTQKDEDSDSNSIVCLYDANSAIILMNKLAGKKHSKSSQKPLRRESSGSSADAPTPTPTPLFYDSPSDASQSEMMVKISDAVEALLSQNSSEEQSDIVTPPSETCKDHESLDSLSSKPLDTDFSSALRHLDSSPMNNESDSSNSYRTESSLESESNSNMKTFSDTHVNKQRDDQLINTNEVILIDSTSSNVNEIVCCSSNNPFQPKQNSLNLNGIVDQPFKPSQDMRNCLSLLSAAIETCDKELSVAKKEPSKAAILTPTSSVERNSPVCISDSSDSKFIDSCSNPNFNDSSPQPNTDSPKHSSLIQDTQSIDLESTESSNDSKISSLTEASPYCSSVAHDASTDSSLQSCAGIQGSKLETQTASTSLSSSCLDSESSTLVSNNLISAKVGSSTDSESLTNSSSCDSFKCSDKFSSDSSLKPVAAEETSEPAKSIETQDLKNLHDSLCDVPESINDSGEYHVTSTDSPPLSYKSLSKPFSSSSKSPLPESLPESPLNVGDTSNKLTSDNTHEVNQNSDLYCDVRDSNTNNEEKTSKSNNKEEFVSNNSIQTPDKDLFNDCNSTEIGRSNSSEDLSIKDCSLSPSEPATEYTSNSSAIDSSVSWEPKVDNIPEPKSEFVDSNTSIGPTLKETLLNQRQINTKKRSRPKGRRSWTKLRSKKELARIRYQKKKNNQLIVSDTASVDESVILSTNDTIKTSTIKSTKLPAATSEIERLAETDNEKGTKNDTIIEEVKVEANFDVTTPDSQEITTSTERDVVIERLSQGIDLNKNSSGIALHDYLKSSYIKDTGDCVLCGVFVENELKLHVSQHHSCITYVPALTSQAFRHHMQERIGDVSTRYTDSLYGNPTYICRSCDAVFKTMGSVRLHINEHQDIFSIQLPLNSQSTCETCSNNYFSFPQYKWRKLLKDSTFECNACYFRFSCRSSFVSHLRVCHLSDGRCKLCSEEVKETDSLQLIQHNELHINNTFIDLMKLLIDSKPDHCSQSQVSWNALGNYLNYLDGKSFRLNTVNENKNYFSDRRHISFPLEVDPEFAMTPKKYYISPASEMVKYMKGKLARCNAGEEIDEYVSTKFDVPVQIVVQQQFSTKKKRKPSLKGSESKKTTISNCRMTRNSLGNDLNLNRVYSSRQKNSSSSTSTSKQNNVNARQKKSASKKVSKKSKEALLLSRTRSGMKSKDEEERDDEELIANETKVPPEVTTPSSELVSPAEVTGEWVNSHTFVCCSCGSVFLDLAEIMDHKWMAHPGVWCAHTMIQGQNAVPKIFCKQYLPANANKPSMGAKKKKKEQMCSQCGTKFTNAEAFHLHLVECGGLNLLVHSKKRSKKGFRFKRRHGQGVPNRRYGNITSAPTPSKIENSGNSTPNKDTSQKTNTSVVKRRLELAIGSIEDSQLKNKLKKVIARASSEKNDSVGNQNRSIRMKLRRKLNQTKSRLTRHSKPKSSVTPSITTKKDSKSLIKTEQQKDAATKSRRNKDQSSNISNSNSLIKVDEAPRSINNKKAKNLKEPNPPMQESENSTEVKLNKVSSKKIKAATGSLKRKAIANWRRSSKEKKDEAKETEENIVEVKNVQPIVEPVISNQTKESTSGTKNTTKKMSKNKEAIKAESDDPPPHSPTNADTLPKQPPPVRVRRKVRNNAILMDSHLVDDSDSSEPEVTSNFRRNPKLGRLGLRHRASVVPPRYSLRPPCVKSELEKIDAELPQDGVPNSEDSSLQNAAVEVVVPDAGKDSDSTEIIRPRKRARRYNIGDDEDSDSFISSRKSSIASSLSGGEEILTAVEKPIEAVFSENMNDESRLVVKEEPEKKEVPKRSTKRKSSNPRKATNKVKRLCHFAQRKFSRLKLGCYNNNTTDSESSSAIEGLKISPKKLPRRKKTKSKVLKRKVRSDSKSSEIESIVPSDAETIQTNKDGKINYNEESQDLFVSQSPKEDLPIEKKNINRKRRKPITPKIVPTDSESDQDGNVDDSYISENINIIPKEVAPVIVSTEEESSLKEVVKSIKKTRLNKSASKIRRKTVSHCKRRKSCANPVVGLTPNDLEVPVVQTISDSTSTTIASELPGHDQADKLMKTELFKKAAKRKYTIKKHSIKDDGPSNTNPVDEVKVLSYKSLNTSEDLSSKSSHHKIDAKNNLESERAAAPVEKSKVAKRKCRKRAIVELDENFPVVDDASELSPVRHRRKKFASENSLKDDNSSKTFFCIDCGLSFDSSLSREDHRQDCRNIAFEMSLMAEDHLFECPYCQLTFALKGTQRQHSNSCRAKRNRKSAQRRRSRHISSSKKSHSEVALKSVSDIPSENNISSLVVLKCCDEENKCDETESKCSNAESEVIELESEQKPKITDIAMRLYTSCLERPELNAVCALSYHHKLCSSDIRTSLTSSSTTIQPYTVLQVNASSNNASSNGSYKIFEDIVHHSSWINLPSVFEICFKNFFKNDVPKEFRTEDSSKNQICITISRPELLRALSSLEDLLREAEDVQNLLKKEQMLLTMKETFQAGTGS